MSHATCHQHLHVPKAPQQAYTMRRYGGKEQTLGRGRIGGARNHSGMASGHTASPYPTTKE
jgi:hypothetical protein